MSVPQTPHWRVRKQAQLRWQTWGDESVVFSTLTGDTHYLDLLASTGLRLLERQSCQITELVEHLAAQLEIDADSQLQRYAEQLVENFAALGLIEACDPCV